MFQIGVASAHLAHTIVMADFCLIKIGIFLSELMPIFAVSLFSVHSPNNIRTNPAPQIYCSTDRLKVAWIDAMPNAAQMVQIHSVRNRAN